VQRKISLKPIYIGYLYVLARHEAGGGKAQRLNGKKIEVEVKVETAS
jgi:hypothetical protein